MQTLKETLYIFVVQGDAKFQAIKICYGIGLRIQKRRDTFKILCTSDYTKEKCFVLYAYKRAFAIFFRISTLMPEKIEVA